LPLWKDTIEPTEEFDCDVTIELPCPGGAPVQAQTRAIQAADCAVAVPSAGEAKSATTSSVLCERYALEQPLGIGGTGVISRARDLWRDEANGSDPYVAIKRLRPELRERPGSIARLRREFHQTRSLTHPNIIRFYDFDCDRGTWFIAMECLSGEALGQRLRRAEQTGLPPREALRIATACGAALEFAHGHGVTHGDVKPDNVFVTAGNEVRVLDFGVAADPIRLAAGGQAGIDQVAPAATRAYASPEVLAGQGPEPRDDVFSLACMIYEMLSGRHPYGRRGANEARDEGVTIKSLPGLSKRQWHALATGLAWRREQRPADVRALLQAFGANAPAETAAQSITRLPVFNRPPNRQWRPSQAWRGAMAIACVAVLGVLSGAVGFGSSSDAQSALPEALLVQASTAVTLAAAASTPGDVVTKAIPAPANAAGAATRPRPARVSFESASMVVSRRAIAAAIPVHRPDQAGQRLRADWRVVEGTAIAGRDIGTERAGVVRFTEGQTVSIIYVPLIAGSDAAPAGDRFFTIELTGAATRANLAGLHRVVVTIQGDG